MQIEILKSQRQFLYGKSEFRLLVGGLGSGKTEGGLLLAIKLLIENRGVDIGYFMPTFSLVKLRGIDGFEKILKKMNLEYIVNKSDTIISVFGFGKIILKSYDIPNNIVSFEVFASVIDELDILKFENAKNVFEKIDDRTRQQGNDKRNTVNIIAVVTTPNQGTKGFVYDFFVNKDSENKEIIKAKTIDNVYLPKGYIKRLRQKYDPIQVKLFTEGEFVNLFENLVYHFYHKENHHTDKTLKDFRELHIGLDFNIGSVIGIVFGIIGNKVYAVYEFKSYDTFEFINNLNAKFKNKDIYIYPDASGKSRKTNASESDVDMIKRANYKVRVKSVNPAVRDRINTVNNLFSKDKLFVNSETCKNLSNALESQGYNKKGEPEKFDTHPSVDDWVDSFGYMLAYKFNKQNKIEHMRIIGY